MSVTFEDYSGQLKAIVEEVKTAWLHEQSNEIASRAKDTCTLTDDNGQLRGSYRAEVGQDEATVGTPLEAGWWEEWGTGEHAVKSPHRTGWWVYIEGQDSRGGGKAYATREDAEKAAAFLRGAKSLKARVTNGRDPNYTLEKAFKIQKPKAKKRLQEMMSERLGQ